MASLYWLLYYVRDEGDFDLYFDHFPTSDETRFLTGDDILCATLFAYVDGDWVRRISYL